MFKVQNADFIADKLASELQPDQEFREALQNAIEAVQRRMARDGSATGRIEFDVDWPMLEATGNWYIAGADNGDGMDRHELERYTTTLAVVGAGGNQSISGNQGMGLKIAGPTRHKIGVLIRSTKGSDRTIVQVGWNPQEKEYDLIPLNDAGAKVTATTEDSFPPIVNEMGSGTVVTFLGNDGQEDTFKPQGRPKSWLFKYLHTRYFRLSHDGIDVFVRVPSGDEDEWPRSAEEASQRQAGKGGRSFNFQKVRGTASVWDDAAETLGKDFRGVVEVPGSPVDGIPPALIRWWVLPSSMDSGTDVTSRTNGPGSLSVLFQNELHDWRTSSSANPYFARFGIIFGKNRIGLIIEPLGETITSDFARAHILAGGVKVMDGTIWSTWADQFRERTPDRIKLTMAEEQARLDDEDPNKAKRIRRRLEEIMRMLRPRRFRKSTTASTRAKGPEIKGAGPNSGAIAAREPGNGTKKKAGRSGIGSVLSQATDDPDGETAAEVYLLLQLEPRWVTEAEAEGMSLVRGNSHALRDRAAALAGEDALTAPVLLLNREFRGFTTLVDVVNDWANPEGDTDKARLIQQAAEEWIEQKMVEAVYGLRQLENGNTWMMTHFDEALSPVGLTAAFMADRYHTLREVKRAVGAVKVAS
jgi:hypothetical protein